MTNVPTHNVSNVMQVGDRRSEGVSLGGATTDKISLYGVTPIAQRTNSAQATVTVTLTTGGVGFVTTAQAQAVVDQLTELRNALVALGAIKGS